MDKKFNIKRTFLLAMIVSLSISALIGIFIFLFGEFAELENRVLLTALSVGIFSVMGLCCSVLYERHTFTPLAISGMVLSVLGFLVTALFIWDVLDRRKPYAWTLLFISGTLTMSLAQASLLLLIRSRNRLVRGALAATLVFISFVALITIWQEIEYPTDNELFFRLYGAVIILDVLGTIVTPILHKMYSGKADTLSVT